MANKQGSLYPTRVETPRLVLTKPTPADLAELEAMHTDPRVMATLGGLLSPEELQERHRQYFAFWERDGFGWWIARTFDGQFVGRGGLRRGRIEGQDVVELGYGLVPPFWGRGLATELVQESVRVGFDVLGIPDLVCFALPGNQASRRVMEKVGFRFERDIEHRGLSHVLYRLRHEDWANEAPPCFRG